MSGRNNLRAFGFGPRHLIVLLAISFPTDAMAQQGDAQGAQYLNTHKIVVYKEDVAGRKAVGTLKPRQVIDYPDRKVLIVDDTDMKTLPLTDRKKVPVRNDLNKIYLRDRVIDTTKPIPAVPEALRALPTSGNQLFLIQFAGPIKDEWLKEIEEQGKVQFVTYIPTNAYLIWTDGPTLEKLRTLATTRPFLQWMGAFHPAYRTHPGVRSMALRDPEKDVEVTVQFVAHDGVDASINVVKGKAKKVLRDVWSVGPYKNLIIVLSPDELDSIAALPDVVNIEPWIEPKLFGERQGQILANQLDASGSQPTGPGYLAWLNGLGFNNTFNFVVNVTDSGLDRGQTTAANLHQDFLDGAGNSRVAYVQEVTGTTIDTTAANNNDIDGHGTINHAIVGGFNNTPDTSGGGTDFEDAAGFQYGLGIAPFVQLGSSRIFNPGFTFPDHTELTNAAYSNGARISSNSWGSGCQFGCCPPGVLGVYDATSQEFDALVRDARPTTASDGGQMGNQEMVIVFAAGNEGGCPDEQLGNGGATAKNTLVVGAGENFNQAGTDGCGTTNAGANDVRDVIGFSSRGPTTDNRVKPDIMAPGTHIYGAASQDPGYTGGGVCDQFRPPGQTLYAWSSGTSHSTPAVAGGAALLRQWFLNQGRPAPSPAMTKAYLMNSTTWMRGTGANDTLPSNTQGMGRMNLERAFDTVPRFVTDQDISFDNSGETHVATGTIADSAEPFRVTLAWTDAPGSTVGNAWINDLDLEVTIDDGTGPVLYRGNNFNNNQSQSGGAADSRNNMESVWLPAGTTGTFTITVRASNIAGDGVPNAGDGTDQDFALLIYNAQAGVTPGQLNISVGLDPDVRLGPGDTTTVRATVNRNGTPESGKTVTFSTADPSLATVSPTSAVTDASGQATSTVRGETSSQATTTVTAEVNGVSASAPVRVPDLSLIGVLILLVAIVLFGALRKRSPSIKR
jgi:hypothetical protein